HSSTDASISADIAFDFGFGVDLNYDPTNPADHLEDFVFIDDASLTGTLDLAANNVDASARFGFLAVDIVDGSATGHAQFGLSLTDPGPTADGRITIAELIAAASSDLGRLVSATFVSIALIALPISEPFLGLTPRPVS